MFWRLTEQPGDAPLCGGRRLRRCSIWQFYQFDEIVFEGDFIKFYFDLMNWGLIWTCNLVLFRRHLAHLLFNNNMETSGEIKRFDAIQIIILSLID